MRDREGCGSKLWPEASEEWAWPLRDGENRGETRTHPLSFPGLHLALPCACSLGLHSEELPSQPGLPGALGGRAVSVFIFVVTAGGGGMEKDSLWQANSQKGSAVFSFHIHRSLIRTSWRKKTGRCELPLRREMGERWDSPCPTPTRGLSSLLPHSEGREAWTVPAEPEPIPV